LFRLCTFSFIYHPHSLSSFPALSLHDALPIYMGVRNFRWFARAGRRTRRCLPVYQQGCAYGIATEITCGRCPHVISVAIPYAQPDRKSTRLNSSHVAISYAVFCLKKKKKNIQK